jgi:hypothetical protein
MLTHRGVHLATQKIWLLKLILQVPYGNILTGILLLALLLPFFYLGAVEDAESGAPALFFSFIIAYIIPIFSYITATSQEALLVLRPQLDLDDEAFAQTQARLVSANPALIALQLGAGAMCGLVHMSFIRGSVSAMATTTLASLDGFISTLGALLVWIIMTTVIYMLIHQAVLFARLGADKVRVSLLNTRQLLPFARVSISSSLAIIGALALFPLMGIESGFVLVESLPGAIATFVPLVALFIIPVWPVHRRIVAMKHQQLETVNERIDACLQARDAGELDPTILGQLAPLLTYRREITEVSTWPFDVGNVTRLLLYLIIPPLTWVAAALIENLLDSVL